MLTVILILVFSDDTSHHEDARIRLSWLHCALCHTWKCQCRYSQRCWYSQVPGYHLLQKVSSQEMSQKLLKDKFLIYSHPAFLFVPHFPNSLKCLYYQQYKIQITLDHLTFYSLALPRFEIFAVILLVMSLSLN